jgi:hypothetical protein
MKIKVIVIISCLLPTIMSLSSCRKVDNIGVEHVSETESGSAEHNTGTSEANEGKTPANDGTVEKDTVTSTNKGNSSAAGTGQGEESRYGRKDK